MLAVSFDLDVQLLLPPSFILHLLEISNSNLTNGKQKSQARLVVVSGVWWTVEIFCLNTSELKVVVKHIRM